MQKLMAMIVMAFLLLSLVPSVWADRPADNLQRLQRAQQELEEDEEIDDEDELDGADNETDEDIQDELELDKEDDNDNETDDQDETDELKGDKDKKTQVVPKVAKRILTAKALNLTLNMEQIRQHQEEKLMLAVEKCREKGLDEELCKEKFEKRVELVKKLEEKDLERLKKLELKKQETLNELARIKKMPAFAKFDEKREFSARTVSREKLAKAEENFENARAKLERAKEKYDIAKKGFEQAKDSLKSCEGEECGALRATIQSNIKDSLLQTVEIAENKLAQIKDKLAESEMLTADEDKEAASWVDEALLQLDAIKSTLSSKAELSKEELKEATLALKSALKKTTTIAKKATLKLANARIGGIIVKSKHLELKLERIVAKAAERGINTDSVAPLIDQFAATLADSSQSYNSALALFKEGKVQEAQDAMKDSHKKLQTVHILLKNIVAKLRSLGLENELEATPEAEVESEVESELQETEE